MKTYGDLQLIESESRWCLSGIPPHVAIKLKNLFPHIAKTETTPFFFKNTKEICCDLEWFLARYPMMMSKSHADALIDGADGFRSLQEENYKILSSDYVPRIDVGFREGKELYKPQAVAVELFWKVNRLLIADIIGAGKTVEAIGCLMKPEFLPAIVVVQPHLQGQWFDMFQEFCDLKVHIVKTGKTYPLDPHDVYIFKYTNITKWIDTLICMDLKTFVLDEIQEVRRVESSKHQSCKKIADGVVNCLALSGTPIVNYGDETFNIYSVIKPGILGTRAEFGREWLNYGGRVSDPKALGSYLHDQFAYIRRTETGAKGVNKIVHTVGFDQAAIDNMEKRAKTLAVSVLQGSFVEKGQASRELSVMVRKATGISKAKYVAEYVKMILENDEQVLLAGWHRACYDIWLKELSDYNPCMYTGSESPSQKVKSKKDFISGQSRVMFISLRSGIGLDGLQYVENCSYVVFGELDWSSTIHDQVSGRLARRGQEKQVTAIFLVSDSGSDPIVVDICGVKKSQSDGIFDPFKKKEKQLSDDRVIKEYAKRLLGKG